MHALKSLDRAASEEKRWISALSVSSTRVDSRSAIARQVSASTRSASGSSE